MLVRHGQSEWNRENRFTGWEDPPLTSRGQDEARATAQKMRAANITFDGAFVSYLRRAVETLWLIQQEMNLMWLPTATDWRLNERHYGALQGENKSEIARQHGEEQVLLWRRGYEDRPPPGEPLRVPDHRYADAEVPRGENLADTRARAAACYESRILPLLRARRRVLAVAHGNTLRALMMHLGDIAPADAMRLEIPTGGAAAYKTDENGVPIPPHFFIN